VSSDHLGELIDALPVGLDCGVGTEVYAHPAAPAQHNVQVTIGDGELAAHQELTLASASQQVLLDEGELLAQLLDLSRLALLTERSEEGSEVGVHFTGSVVEGGLNKVSLACTICCGNSARSLFMFVVK
jgi:hypothetical protein